MGFVGVCRQLEFLRDPSHEISVCALRLVDAEHLQKFTALLATRGVRALECCQDFPRLGLAQQILHAEPVCLNPLPLLLLYQQEKVPHTDFF